MSNVGRPREGLKPCRFCKSTERDTNGQCHCRNVLYRATRLVTKSTADKAKAHYNAVLVAKKGDIEKALADTREEYPSLVKPRAKSKGEKTGDALVKAAQKQTAKQKKAQVDKAEQVIDAAKAKAAERAAAAEVLATAPVEHGLRPVVDDSFDGDKYECMCGFQGKNSAPSIRSHVSREKRLAEQSTAA